MVESLSEMILDNLPHVADMEASQLLGNTNCWVTIEEKDFITKLRDKL